MKTPSNITIREAGPADAAALRRLAELDSAQVPAGRTLIAEHDGEPVAALGLTGRAAIADPFHFTASTVRMLELRACQLLDWGTGRRRRLDAVRAVLRTRRGLSAGARRSAPRTAG